MDKEYNLLGVVKILMKWKKHILIVSVAAGLIATAYSFLFMDDYYKSYATLYPINLAYNDRAAIFHLEHVDYYGSKDDVNRVLTIAQSRPIADFIIAKYNLVDHYKISKEKKYWKTKVQKEFDDNYKPIKTDQGAVELTMYDTDPKMAMDIINDIITLTDSTYRTSVMLSKRQQSQTFAKQLLNRQIEIARYGDTLAMLGKKSHIVVRAGFDKTDIIDGDDLNAVQIYKAIYSKQKNALIEYNENSNIREQIENSLQNDSKSLAVIDTPAIADRKDKPVRSLICLTAVLVTFVFSIFGALLFDQIQAMRTQL